MSEFRAVWLLYGLAIASGFLALLVSRLDWLTSIAVIMAVVIALSLLGIYLAGVRVYDEAEFAAARQRPVISFIVDLSHKRRVFEVLLDLVLVLLAFYTANALLNGPVGENLEWTLLSVVSVLVLTQMLSMLAGGSYRGIWRYVSIDNLVVYAKSIVFGTALGYLVLRFLVRLEDMRPALFVVDGVLLFIMVAASRVAFRLFRYFLPLQHRSSGRRALIFGAGDGGEILLRELQNNDTLGLTPIGFIDDDPLKAGRNIHGLPVHLATPHGIPAICEGQRANEVVVSTSRLSGERLDQIVRTCNEAGIVCRRLTIQLDVVSPSPADSETYAGRHRFTVDPPSATTGEIRKRRDSQPVLTSDVTKRRDSKPMRAI